ncbi:uncharacterized protein GIQ15_06790 [Arthroderma uncinatum]|uniref:uncharacterized protein n=1 Tax=Arthroderma uncinatum TaxID=74035 RepID=UPI00144A9FF0|nr:uncharacterized protein GIQ15_06790 [Arthroderma uncinatum]KAF3479814.1 hypothetical protein GIQ15_06790 [Arthroderma uncinatum]
MAVYFGRGASYDTIYNQFRKYRQEADLMVPNGLRRTAPSTPNRRRPATTSTPRSGRGSVTKSVSATKTAYTKAYLETPTKKGIIKKEGNRDDPIVLEDEDDNDAFVVKREREDAKPSAAASEVKREPVIAMEAISTQWYDQGFGRLHICFSFWDIW